MAKVFAVVLLSIISMVYGAAIIDPIGVGPLGFTGRPLGDVFVGEAMKRKFLVDDILGIDAIGTSGLSRKDVVLKSFCDAFAVNDIKCKIIVNDILRAFVSGAPEFAETAVISYCNILPIDTFKCKVLVDDIFKADILGAPELADASLRTLGDILATKTIKRGFFGGDDTESLKMVAADAAKRSLDDALTADVINRKVLAVDTFGAKAIEELKIAGAEAAKRSLENALIADEINRKVPTDIFTAQATEALKIVAADATKKMFDNVLVADVLDRKGLAADIFSADATDKLKMVAADAAIKTSDDALFTNTIGTGFGGIRGLARVGLSKRRLGGAFFAPMDVLFANKMKTGFLRTVL